MPAVFDERRNAVEAALDKAGVNGPYGLLKFEGARVRDGIAVDSYLYQIDEIFADQAGKADRVLITGPNGQPFWMDPGAFVVVSCPGLAGAAGMFADTRLSWPDRVDLITVAPLSTLLGRYTEGKAFKGEIRRRSVVIVRPGKLPAKSG